MESRDTDDAVLYAIKRSLNFCDWEARSSCRHRDGVKQVASIIPDTILGVPYFNHSIMGPKTLF